MRRHGKSYGTRKPLRRGKRLRADPTKQREWERRSRKPLPRQSGKRLARAEVEREVRLAVWARDGGCLLADGREPWGRCWGPRTFHHLQKASQGGPYTEENGVCLCLGHNAAQEDHPYESRAIGLTVTKLIDHDEARRRRIAAGLQPA